MSFDKTQDAFIRLRGIIAERTSRIVVWCGSGLSAQAGLPTWPILRQRLSLVLRDKATSLASEDGQAVHNTISRIASIDSHWVALQMLREELGTTTYQQTIREALRTPIGPLPRPYVQLWRLRPLGVLNLNLDRIATRAFTELHKDRVIAEFNSRSVGAHTHVLKSPDPFVYNLHGVTEDATSWVFTHEDLKDLSQLEAYQTFVRSVFASSTVIFLGVSADDQAVGGHLERLAAAGIDSGVHYWITDRRDRETDRWAERASVRVIRYHAPNGDHSQLTEIFDELLAFVPPDEQPTPDPVITVRDLPPAALPEPNELAGLDAETIRIILNRRAMEILGPSGEQATEEYDRFCGDYDEAMHRAWYTSTQEGRNILLGYKLHNAVAQGAFGKVFFATTAEGEAVAVKVLLNEIRSKPELLHSFRRGVRSMRILASRGVKGMVAYRDASEIPAFVVMDWIEGANLEQAIEAKCLEDWWDIIKVSRQLSGIVRDAHALPERVMHRDLRPRNVMLRGLWSGEDWDVVVLDFDLSWHRGSYEKSIIHGSGTAGYLAPEQIQAREGVSTRHSAVDSFGLGMTMFFIVSGRDPVPDEHQHKGWEDTVSQAVRWRDCKPWHSLPRRFSRLILAATADSQSERWDVAQIVGELERLAGAIADPRSERACDLVAEEVAARSDVLQLYQWNPDRMSAMAELPSGIQVELRGDESKQQLLCEFGWSSRGDGDWSRITKWLPQAAEAMRHCFEKGGWSVETSEGKRYQLQVRAMCGVDAATSDLTRTAALIDKAARLLRFE